MQSKEGRGVASALIWQQGVQLQNYSSLRNSTFAAMRLPSPLLASAFAKTCGAELHGPDQHFHGVNEIHNVEAGDLTFVDHPKYYISTLRSAASVILIDKQPSAEQLQEVSASAKTLLVHPEPFAVYDALVKQHRPVQVLNERIAVNTNIHPSAVIEPGAVVGPRVTIGAHTIVQAGAVIIGPARIGAHCAIGANTVIGDKAFYFRKTQGTYTRWTSGGEVVIDDWVEIGPNCCIARGVSSETRIGEGSKLDAAIMVGHDTKIGKHCLFAAQVGIAGNVTIGDGVLVYGQVGIAQNVTIGDGAMLHAKCGVSKNLPGGQAYNGSPAQPAALHYREKAAVRRLGRGEK